jgi:hypothetical protein
MISIGETNDFGIDRRRCSSDAYLLDLIDRNVFVEIAIQAKPWRTQTRGALNPRRKTKATVT